MNRNEREAGVCKSTVADRWAVEESDFPANGTPTEKWKFLLRYAVLAPSTHNTQPWLFHLRGEELDLYADRRRACRVVDPADRELIMSCGCALFHLCCAARQFACLGTVTLFPELRAPDLLALLRLGDIGNPSDDETSLFRAILKRRTNRQPFERDPVPLPLLGALASAALAEGAWLHFIEEGADRVAVARLIAEGDRSQWANKMFRAELARWVHGNHSTRRDGIPTYAQGIDDLLSSTGPMVIRTFDMGDGQAARDHDVATGSPVLAILGTDGDTPRDWMLAGQALSRVLLRARAGELWASFLNQPVELEGLRSRLGRLIGRNGFPQIVLRLGFSEGVRPTPRRSVEEVLI